MTFHLQLVLKRFQEPENQDTKFRYLLHTEQNAVRLFIYMWEKFGGFRGLSQLLQCGKTYIGIASSRIQRKSITWVG
jgi:hypothetical protein